MNENQQFKQIQALRRALARYQVALVLALVVIVLVALSTSDAQAQEGDVTWYDVTLGGKLNPLRVNDLVLVDVLYASEGEPAYTVEYSATAQAIRVTEHEFDAPALLDVAWCDVQESLAGERIELVAEPYGWDGMPIDLVTTTTLWLNHQGATPREQSAFILAWSRAERALVIFPFWSLAAGGTPFGNHDLCLPSKYTK